MSERLFTEADAAELLGISRKCLERYRRAKKINPQRVGKTWCYTMPQLNEWREKYGAGVAEKQAQLAGSKLLQPE